MLIVCFSKVRQGLLFAISMVYLAVPPVTLLNDLQNEVFESKIWLQGIPAIFKSEIMSKSTFTES